MAWNIPEIVPNWIAGEDTHPSEGAYYPKICPHSGKVISEVARSQRADVHAAVFASQSVQPIWAKTPGVQRGAVLWQIARTMEDRKKDLAEIVSLETGKSIKDAIGEVGAVIQQAQFMAGEGQRLFGKTTTSGITNRFTYFFREPVGICGLIVAANTPLANIAWKVFPALICGNAVVLKAAEDTPITAWAFSRVVGQHIQPGLINIVYGIGEEAGSAVVEDPNIRLISFTGSAVVGRQIAEKVSSRLGKCFLELGGKNAMVICDDANFENALKWALLSSFSNAGQRCAASSRILIFENIYERFRDQFVAATKSLKIGPTDNDDLGPVINEQHLNRILAAVEVARREGAKVLTGGRRLTDPFHANGFYLEPTILENADSRSAVSKQELFGPVTNLYSVRDLHHAIEMANCADYGLTSSIHTTNFNRVFEYSRQVAAGIVSINGGTHGSEPHIPFGGVKNSGTGGREPGTEAIEVYSELKVVFNNFDSNGV